MSQVVTARGITYRKDDLMALINAKRISNGVSPLKYNQQLNQAAQQKAEDMSKNNYFSHVSPIDGTKWSNFIESSGYNYVEAGENLANGFDNPNEMVESWMDSPTHRQNIVSKGMKETGFGIALGKLDETPTVFVVQVFGRENN
ncbi:CAP domain-containing protein [Candidatus Gracilibacteria bacterium]|nr:CAP domain-containing protein [Thermales bacterium]NJL96291.1 CAP domain-containing protein [Candidatus Gracilibacteria bacterium]NJS41695.1 CAP domain-containing protein [Candidatus Gracilibacteria bacterium]